MRKKSDYFLLTCVGSGLALAGLAFWLLPRAQEPSKPITKTATPPSAHPASAEQPNPKVASAEIAVQAADPGEMKLALALQKIYTEEKDPLEWEGEIDRMARGLDLAGVQELLRLSDDAGLPKGIPTLIRSAALSRWFELDKAASLRAADQGILAGQTAYWLQMRIKLWAAQSPQEVFDFLRQQPLASLPRAEVYSRLAQGAAQAGDRESMARALANVPNPPDRLTTVRAMAQSLQQYHPELMSDWIQSATGNERLYALSESAQILAQTNVPAALQQLQAMSGADAQLIFRTASPILVEWTKQNPPEAIGWLLHQPFPQEQKEMALATSLRVWLRSNPEQVSAWMKDSVTKGSLDLTLLEKTIKRL